MRIESYSPVHRTRCLEFPTPNGSNVLHCHWRSRCRPEQGRTPELLVKEPRGPSDIRHQIVVHHELHRRKRHVVSVELGRLARRPTPSQRRDRSHKRKARGICEEIDGGKSVPPGGSGAAYHVGFGIQSLDTLFGRRNGCPSLWVRELCASPET